MSTFTRAQLNDLDSQRKSVTAEERNALLAFVERFADVWNHPRLG